MSTQINPAEFGTTSKRLAAFRAANGWVDHRGPRLEGTPTASQGVANALARASGEAEPFPRGSAGVTATTETPAPKASAPAPQAVTQTDVAIAGRMAREEERERVAKVFADPASRGRERACAAALASTKGYSADQIIATLPKLPLDASAAAEVRAERSKAAAEVWERAIVANGGTPAPARPSDPWGAAIADMTRRSH